MRRSHGLEMFKKMKRKEKKKKKEKVNVNYVHILYN